MEEALVTAHKIWHFLRRKPEHQDQEARNAYRAKIPVDFADRKNEARHALEHGVLYYSHPALEAYLDYAETDKQLEIVNEPPPPGLSPEQLDQFHRDKNRSIKGILALGEARKYGVTGGRVIYPFLSHLWVMRSIFDITGDFLDLKAVPNHPLEECPDPPK